MSDAPTLGELERESAADSMRAIISDMGDAGEPAAASEPEAQPAVTTGDTNDDKAESDAAEAAERPRDGKGRFTAKEEGGEAAATDNEPAGADAEVVSEESPGDGANAAAEEAGDDTAEPLEPLPEWTAAQHEEFRKLTRTAQQFVLDQVAAANTKAQEAAQGAGRYQAIEEMLAPRRQAFARDGLDDAGALRQLFALSDFAAKDGASFARWFIQNRGLRPEDIFGQPNGQTDAQSEFADDPVYNYSRQEIAGLKQEVDKLSGIIQNQQNSVQEQSQQQIVSEIEAFGKAADDSGRPKHPYFDQVRPLMGSIMGSGRASDLETAYDMACRADPEVHAKIAAADKARADRETQRQRRAKAEAASQAGKSISGSPAERAQPEPSGNIREDMANLFSEQGTEVTRFWNQG